ncbi:MAG: glutathione S-transferase family protein [Alphaproteobacteria bacterium]|nr:MAG: glutathione S-transferase family protein [Alphaproteobacteria bacterium]
MSLELFNFRYSVYGWIVRMVLEEKGLAYEAHAVNPFSTPLPEGYLDLHPFGRVPVLRHDGFTIYETVAITGYLDDAFNGPMLQPADARSRARMRQIISIADNYAYIPLVRQVFSHRVFRSAMNEAADEKIVAEGLAAAVRILDALENLLASEGFAAGPQFSLADAHLGAMMGYFTMADEGAHMIASRPKLDRWWQRMAEWPSLVKTRPSLA